MSNEAIRNYFIRPYWILYEVKNAQTRETKITTEYCNLQEKVNMTYLTF